MLRRLARRLLARLAYPPCAAGRYCRPYTQHSTHSIRDVCLLCGRVGPWQKVIIDLPTHPPNATTRPSQLP